MPGLLAFGASLGLFLELGPEAVSDRILDRAGCRARELAVSAGWRLFGSTAPGRPLGDRRAREAGRRPRSRPPPSSAARASSPPAGAAGFGSARICTITPTTWRGSAPDWPDRLGLSRLFPACGSHHESDLERSLSHGRIHRARSTRSRSVIST